MVFYEELMSIVNQCKDDQASFVNGFGIKIAMLLTMKHITITYESSRFPIWSIAQRQ